MNLSLPAALRIGKQPQPDLPLPAALRIGKQPQADLPLPTSLRIGHPHAEVPSDHHNIQRKSPKLVAPSPRPYGVAKSPLLDGRWDDELNHFQPEEVSPLVDDDEEEDFRLTEPLKSFKIFPYDAPPTPKSEDSVSSTFSEATARLGHSITEASATAPKHQPISKDVDFNHFQPVPVSPLVHEPEETSILTQPFMSFAIPPYYVSPLPTSEEFASSTPCKTTASPSYSPSPDPVPNTDTQPPSKDAIRDVYMFDKQWPKQPSASPGRDRFLRPLKLAKKHPLRLTNKPPIQNDTFAGMGIPNAPQDPFWGMGVPTDCEQFKRTVWSVVGSVVGFFYRLGGER